MSADDKCPKCGSTNSRCYSVIDYKDGRTCELQCRDCGEYFQYDEDDKEISKMSEPVRTDYCEAYQLILIGFILCLYVFAVIGLWMG